MNWTRLAPGHYTSGDYRVSRQPTTFGTHRASNPMWFVYFKGQALSRHSTLHLARAQAERYMKQGDPR